MSFISLAPSLAAGALASRSKQKSSLDELNDLYQRTVGRNVDKGGYDYWSEQLANNQTSLANIEAALLDSQEFKERAATVKQYQDSGKGNPAESVLDALDSAYKGEFASPVVSTPSITFKPVTSVPSVPSPNPTINVAGPTPTVPSPNPPAPNPTINLAGPTTAPTTSEADNTTQEGDKGIYGHPDFTPPEGIATQAFEDWINTETGEKWSANTGGWSPKPGSGWVRDNTTQEETMSTLTKDQVTQLYNELLGRDPVFGDASEFDADYWLTGHTLDQARSGITGSDEFKGRLDLVTQAGDKGISEADLDSMILPGGVKTKEHPDWDPTAMGGWRKFNDINWPGIYDQNYDPDDPKNMGYPGEDKTLDNVNILLQQLIDENASVAAGNNTTLPANNTAQTTSEAGPTLGINDIFTEYLGRDAGEEGKTYWNKKFNELLNTMGPDEARAQILAGIQSGDEYKGRKSLVDYFQNKYNLNPSEAFLDSYIGPGGTQLRDLPTMQQAAAQQNEGWWNQFADANAFKEFLSEGQQQPSEFDQFMKFITAIQGIGGMGGGMGNYGYGGYGGFTPGGVAAAAPANNMMNFMNAFRNLRGTDGTPAISTGNIGF